MRKLMMVLSILVCTPSTRHEANERTLPSQHYRDCLLV